MKIAILSCFYPYRGGISQFNANIFTELEKSGHTVKAFNFKRQYPSFLFPGKTQFVTPDDEAMPVPSTALLDTINPLSWFRTAGQIAKWGPDILILRYWMPFFAPSLGHVSSYLKKRGTRVVGILDNVIPHERRPFDKALTKCFLSGMDGCVTLCEEVERDLMAIRPGIPHTVLPHPVYSHFGEKLSREDAEKSLGLRPGMKNLLFFGLIRDYKGLDILIDAFNRLDGSYQLIIAGEPYGSFEKYGREIDSSPGKNRIRVFPKYIRDSEVKEYFSAADVVVLPYRSATQSGISSISYHFGVPMIVTAVGGLPESIGGRGTGIVAKDITAECIAGNIESFFKTPGLRESCIKAIEAEKVRLGWKKFCSDLLEFASTLEK